MRSPEFATRRSRSVVAGVALVVPALLLAAMCACDAAGPLRPERDADRQVDGGADVSADIDDALIDASEGSDEGERRCLFDSACAGGLICSAGQCVRRACASDGDCAWAMACRDGACEVAAREACSSGDACGNGRACIGGHCRSRALRSGAVTFALRALPGVTDRTARDLTAEDRGIGAALADIDGDLRLDIVLGWDAGVADLPYIFVNRSTPGALRFDASPILPGHGDALVTTMASVDIDGDGDDELVEAGAQHLHLVDPGPEASDLDLLALIPAGLPDRTCHAGPVMAADLDYSGTLDLLVGCQGTYLADYAPMGRPRIPIQLWLGDGTGAFAWEDRDGFEAIRGAGDVLALGAIDANGDGLLDLVAAADTLSNPEARNTAQWPGGYFMACSPLEACRYRYHRFADDEAAWGSFMGVAGFTTVRESLVYLSDWGANRALSFGGSSVVDRAVPMGVDLPDQYARQFQSSWATLVDDFDRNGLDDLYIARSPPSLSLFHTYTDVVLLQYGDEQFDVVDRPHSFPTRPDALGHPWPFVRGGTRADLDHDGQIEVLLGTMLRRLVVMSEVAAAGVDEPRCTVVPRARVVPGSGVGYRVADNWSERFRVRDVQGQHRFGQSSQLALSFGRGVIEFPSGARVAFDCAGTAGPVVVEEPDWIDVSVGSTAVIVTLDAPWIAGAPDVSVAAQDSSGLAVEIVATRIDTDQWRAELPDGAERVMVRIDDRWVARWWERAGRE